MNMQASRSGTETLVGVFNLAPRFLAAKVKREIGPVRLSSLSLRKSLPSFLPIKSHGDCVGPLGKADKTSPSAWR